MRGLDRQLPPRSSLEKLWGRLSDATLARQKLAADKASCYADDFLELVRARITVLYTDPGRRRQMLSYASTTLNVAKSIANAVAVNYVRGIRRHFAEAEEAKARAFADILTESGAALEQGAWGVSAWLCGPTLVIPHVDATTKELALDVVRPDQYDAVIGPGRSLARVLWRCDDRNAWAVIDDKGYRYFGPNGEPLPGSVEHGLGYVPAAIMRSAAELFTGFWGSACGRGLLDASIDAAVTYAQLQYYRKAQVGYLTTIAGEQQKSAAGQSIAEPELPVTFDGEPQSFSVQVLNRDINVRNFVEHLHVIIGAQVQQHGIPASEVTYQQDSSNWGAFALAIRREKLAHLRAQQVPHLVAGELDLWAMACDVVSRSSHRHAKLLPTRDEARKMLVVEFPEIEGTSDPEARLRIFEAGQKHGFTNRVEFYQTEHPLLTQAECEARLAENNRRRFEEIEEARAHQIPFDPATGLETIAQQQGALGGLRRAANQKQENAAT